MPVRAIERIESIAKEHRERKRDKDIRRGKQDTPDIHPADWVRWLPEKQLNKMQVPGGPFMVMEDLGHGVFYIYNPETGNTHKVLKRHVVLTT